MPATTAPANLTGSDRRVLAALKATAWITNNALKARDGFTLVGAQRRRLNAAGLVTSRKAGRCFEHILTGEAPKGAEPVTVESRIVAAIETLPLKLNTTFSRWVSLVNLRAELADIDRARLDAALKDLFRARRVRIVPEDNRKAMTDADHSAAIVIGDEPKHFVQIVRED